MSWRAVVFLGVPIFAVYVSSFFMSFGEVFGTTYTGWDVFRKFFPSIMWLANPVYWTGICLLPSRRSPVSLVAGGLGLFAAVLAVGPLLIQHVKEPTVPATARHLEFLQFLFDPRLPCGCWVLSMMLLAIAGIGRGIWISGRTTASE